MLHFCCNLNAIINSNKTEEDKIMPKLYYENISQERFDELFDSCKTLNEKFEFMNNYLLSYGIDEVDEREETNVVNLLNNPAEYYIHHAREKFLAAVLKEKEAYNNANVKQLDNAIVNPEEPADSKAQIAMQQFIQNPARYLSQYARFRLNGLDNVGNDVFKNEDDRKRYQKNLKYVSRQFGSVSKIFDTNEKNRFINDVLTNSKKANHMPDDATPADIIRHNKGGVFEKLFRRTSNEYKAFVKAYREFHDENSSKYGDETELEKATRAYIQHKIPGYQLPNKLPDRADIERFSGTSRERLELCVGVLATIQQRSQRNLMIHSIGDANLSNANVNQDEFQNKINNDIQKDEVVNINNEVVENNDIEIQNEAHNSNN